MMFDHIILQLLPFVLVILGCLMVITDVPSISLFLRDLVYRCAAVRPLGSALRPARAPATRRCAATSSAASRLRCHR